MPDNWPVNRIGVDVDQDVDAAHGADEIPVDAGFDIPLRNPLGIFSVIGLVLHIIGWILMLVMAILFVAGYPDNWEISYEWIQGDVLTDDESFRDNIINQEEINWLKERVAILGLLGSAFLFVGLALYQYGRTFKGTQEEDAQSRGVVTNE